MRIGLIGAGNMARAMARGWGDPVLCSDGGSGRAAILASELGGRAAGNLEVAREADLVVLCHKPAQLERVAEEIRDEVRCLASVLGPTTVRELQAAYPGASVFRMMPNTPVEIGHGVVCYAPASRVDAELEREVVGEFERLGSLVAVPERLINVASGISGVGPAYQALLAEAQMDAGVRHGLSPALAGRLVAETMSGSAALLKERGYDTLAMRREVTSPGGSTARGLAALERSRLRNAFQAAMDAVCGEPAK
jgi:pyrroline-5-carboxylate reductase